MKIDYRIPWKSSIVKYFLQKGEKLYFLLDFWKEYSWVLHHLDIEITLDIDVQ